MAKYSPLKEHLSKYKGSKLPLTFKEIEGIIRTNLPPSAYNYNLRQWWQNSYSPSRQHVQAKAWHDAGWRVQEVDIRKQEVVFVRESKR